MLAFAGRLLLVALLACGLASGSAGAYGYDPESKTVAAHIAAPPTTTTLPATLRTVALQARSSSRAAVGSAAAWGSALAAKGAPRGQFSIRNWDDYPQGVPRPTGELRLRTGAEYDRARSAANQVNAQLRRTNPDAYRGKQIHEIHPLKFGGSPTDPANKIALTRQEHYRLNAFWMRHQRYAEGGP